MNKKNFHLAFGVLMLLLGGYGIYDEWFNVIDLITGIVNICLILAGLVLLFLGTAREKHRKINYVLGGALFFIGLYGLYDEWRATKDLLSGVVPVACILFGGLALTLGIKKLKET